MANRSRVWQMNPGEKLDLAASLEDHLDADELLEGDPVVSVWKLTAPDTYTNVTASLGFVVELAQVNAVTLPLKGGGEIPIGKGIAFRLTAGPTRGVYEVRAECPADDGTGPATVRALKVTGPGSPS